MATKKSSNRADNKNSVKRNTASREQNVDEKLKTKPVEVNPNTDKEAVHGTTKESKKSEVKNTESIPQNGVTEVKTQPEEAPNPVSKAADEARTKDEVKFADESNPNQKARTKGAQDLVDVDGNERTGGKSYGVAEDDPNAPAPKNTKKSVAGEAPRSSSRENEPFKHEVTPPGQLLHGNTNSEEVSIEDQQQLEEELSDPANGVSARVITSAGSYYKVKFFRNNLAFGTYKSKAFDKAGAVKFRDNLLKEQGLV